MKDAVSVSEYSSLFKYLVANETDALWGLTVTTVGYHRMTVVKNYPPKDHPTEYNFDYAKGRILNEFQMVYITRGTGSFRTASTPLQHVREGDMLLIFPGEWHTYRPDPKTGWDEYWIGFKGPIADNLLKNNFFRKTNPRYYMGISEEVVALYNKAIDAAEEERAGFQQFMAGIVSHLLSILYFNHRNRQFADKEIINRINKAKIIMQENIFNSVSPEEIAEQLNLSYSWFRRAFKEYTGFAPAKYMSELKLQKAKALLVTTKKSIKEISISLNFDNVEYFSTFFKKMTGKPPMEYRTDSTRFTEMQ